MSERPDEWHEYPTEPYYAPGWEPAPRRNPRRMRLVGLIVIGALVLLGGGATVVALLVQRSVPGALPLDVGSATTASPVQLRTGHCVESLPAHGEVTEVTVLPCDEPHIAQVVTQYSFDADALWPGQDAADARVGRACQLTAAQTEAGVRAVAWAPTQASWQRGDRTGLCLAVAPQPVTGSLLDGSAYAA